MNVPLCRRVVEFLKENNREYQEFRNESAFETSSGCPTSVLIDRTDSPFADAVRDSSTYSTFGSAVEEHDDVSVEKEWIGTSS